MSYLTTYTLIDEEDTIERMALHPMRIAPEFWHPADREPAPPGRFPFRVVFRKFSLFFGADPRWRLSCRGVDVDGGWAGRLVCGYDLRTDDAAAIAWLLAGER